MQYQMNQWHQNCSFCRKKPCQIMKYCRFDSPSNYHLGRSQIIFSRSIYSLSMPCFHLCATSVIYTTFFILFLGITCGTSFSNPSNGRVQCTDDNTYESICTFYCDDGFYLEGSTKSVCQETGWTNKEAPMCKRQLMIVF